MKCPACGYFNPAGAVACGHCTLPLPVIAALDALCAVHPDLKAIGACSRCGTFGCGQCLQQSGADWLCEACRGRVVTLPWDERLTLGTWRAWWRTSVLMLSQPTKTCAAVQPEAPIGSSIWFATLSTLVGMGPTILVYAAIMVPMMMFGASSAAKNDLPKFAPALIPAFALLYVVFLLSMQVATVLVFAGIDHLALMLLGANPRSYAVSVRAYSLSMGCYVVGLVPVCGLYVFPIWAIVLRIIALAGLHKTTGGKAAAAVLLPIAVLCGGGIALYVAMIALAASQMR